MTDQEKRESEINVHARAKFTLSDILKFTAAGGLVALLGGISVDPSSSRIPQIESELAECKQITHEYESTIFKWEQWGEAQISSLTKVQRLEAQRSFPTTTARGVK